METSIPGRLDFLPWSWWHWRMVIALGTAWILDGIEVTPVGSLGPALLRPDTLAISAPVFFGALIESGSRDAVFLGYACAAVLMCAAATVAVVLGVDSERKSLENVAKPLSAD